MAGSPPPHYQELLTSLLDAGIAAGNREEVLEPFPGVQTITPGSPAWDCEGLYAWFTSITPTRGPISSAPIQGNHGSCGAIPVIVLNMLLLRCITVSIDGRTPVEVATRSHEGKRLAQDAEALMTEIGNRWTAATLFDGLTCATVSFPSLSVSGPQGGFIGVQITVNVSGI
jgi:hypothetical protein